MITFANDHDFVSFRPPLGVKTGKDEVHLSEVRPRFEMRLFEIRSGSKPQGTGTHILNGVSTMRKEIKFKAILIMYEI
jgi:hypothetical protein